MCDKITPKIQEWVDLALKNQDMFNYETEVDGETDTESDDGDIHFVKVIGFNKSGDEKTLNLAIKSSKENREKAPIEEAFLKEILIFDEAIKTAFAKFLQERGVEELLEARPYCYAAILKDNKDLFYYDNLRTQTVQLRDEELSFEHIKLVLEDYGRWHGLSMALKTQKPDVFKKLVQNNINMFTDIVVKAKFDVDVIQEFENARKLAVGDNEDILKHLQYSPSDVKYAFTDMYFEDPEYQVILHGDFWNSNFLFKSDDKTNPSEVRILDWHVPGLASPVFDLSHFIYCCLDTAKYEDVLELLKVYYDSFSRYLILLGCDSDKVFSFEKLIEHWKKFSHFGLFLSCWVIRNCFLPKKEIPDLAENVEQGEAMFTFDASDDQVYRERVRNHFLHYCKNVE